MIDPITMGSMFSGIGGLDLGLERAGMKVIWQAEIEPYPSAVLARHWPDVPNLGDVTTVDWSTVERPDLICGGYPCQPFSRAGRRLGEDDDRHLWPYLATAVHQLRPRWVLLENVRGHLSLGFGRVLGDLADLGFDAEWDVVPAATVGAPHRRDRVFVVAWRERPPVRVPYPELIPVRVVGERGGQQRGEPGPAVVGDDGGEGDVADADGAGRGERRGPVTVRAEQSAAERGGEALADPEGQPVGTGLRPGGSGRVGRRQPGDGSGEGGTRLFYRGPAPDWPAEPDVGRVADGVPHRVDRLRGLGNAVVPAVAEHVGRLIVEADARGRTG